MSAARSTADRRRVQAWLLDSDQHAAASFERTPESARDARRLVRDTLKDWGLAHLADQAELVVTELVSNAVRHAKGEGLRVTVDRLPTGRVHLAVLDRDPARPQIRPPTPDGVSGRGLLLVDAMSFAWGVDMLPGGKRVWAVLEAAS